MARTTFSIHTLCPLPRMDFSRLSSVFSLQRISVVRLRFVHHRVLLQRAISSG
jgi:hypothetical protein